MAIILCAKVDSRECLFAGQWCDETFGYKLLWVGFLYSVSDPRSHLVQEGKVAIRLVRHMLLRWLRVSIFFPGP
jgi:hypothetical protein